MIMYKHKYYKYKYKYNKRLQQLGKGGPELHSVDDPDELDGQEWTELYSVPDQEVELIAEIDEDAENEELQQVLVNRLKENFGEYEIEKESSPHGLSTDEASRNRIIDIGIFGKARGRIHDVYEFDKTEFVSMHDKPNKSKILRINNKDSFDEFTNKYGKVNRKNKRINIAWNKVANNYKGFYLSSSALGERTDTIPYMDRTTSGNWVDYDFHYADEVVIFKKPRKLLHARQISRPFRGSVVDEYAIEEEEFARITDQITRDKILLIDDVKSFDKFTNKYGFPVGRKDNTYIDIAWDHVNKDYDGFYIDKDNDFEKDRYHSAFYKGQEFPSWLEKNDIQIGIVYLFE